MWLQKQLKKVGPLLHSGGSVWNLGRVFKRETPKSCCKVGLEPRRTHVMGAIFIASQYLWVTPTTICSLVMLPIITIEYDQLRYRCLGNLHRM